MAAATKHTHEVIRPIPGMELKAGDLVDASGWRTAPKLERLRYLKPIGDVVAVREELRQAHARIAELERELARRDRQQAASGRR